MGAIGALCYSAYLELQQQSEMDSVLDAIINAIELLPSNPPKYPASTDTSLLKHVEIIHTQNFHEKLGNEFNLVYFFDPMSVSYRETALAFSHASSMAKHKKLRVHFFAVNAASDGYLQTRYAQEMSEQWQETKEQAKDSFKFGKAKFYAVSIKLFRGMTLVEEYSEAINHVLLLDYTYRLHAADMTDFKSHQLEAAKSFIKSNTPSLAGCFDISNSKCSVETSAGFLQASALLHGQFFFSRINEAICAKIHPEFVPCTIFLNDRGGSKLLTPKLPNFLQELRSFISDFRSTRISELTPDNSWKFLDTYDSLLLIILPRMGKIQNYDDLTEKILAAPYNKSSTPLTFARSSFASQFNVEADDLPVLVAYDAIEANFDSLIHVDELNPSSLSEWIAARTQNVSKKEEPVPDATSKQQEELLNVHDSRNRHLLKIPDLISELKRIYQELLKYLDVMSELSGATQEENAIITPSLNRIFEYVGSRSYLYYLLKPLPHTRRDLARINQTDFWRMIEKVDIFEYILCNKTIGVDLPLLSDHQREKTRAMIHKDVDFFEMVLKQLVVDRSATFLNRFKKEHGRTPESSDIKTIEIERRSATTLTVTEFMENFANARKPLIITDLHMFKRPWTKAHIAETCGSHRVHLNKRDFKTSNWGGLVEVDENITLGEFVSTHLHNESRRQWYLHDWGLPSHCPEIIGSPPFDEFIFPKYFAGDFFQRMPFIGYQHSWPSLFIGAKGTESALHVDSGGTNFWMYLIEGQKEWRFYDLAGHLDLYSDGMSKYDVDPFNPDVEKHPLLAAVPMYHTIQNPNELVFIPGKFLKLFLKIQ